MDERWRAIRSVPEDRAARHRAGRIDGQHRDAVALRDEFKPQRLDERALADARNAADAEPERLAGVGQQRRQHFIALRPVIGTRRFEKRDGFGDGTALRRYGARKHTVG